MPKADIGDAEIYYESHGDGPPLMLVPGLGGGGGFWAKQVPAFAKYFRVIIHDHRGAGQSTHSRIQYSVEQMASDAVKLMDKLEIDTAHYVGHSTGGAMGQVIAQDHPERLRSLVLSATWAGKDPYFRRCFETRKEVLPPTTPTSPKCQRPWPSTTRRSKSWRAGSTRS
jgi:aminoacrylate hydrolase